MTATVDFTSQAFFRDPAAGVARLRALGPVFETTFPIVGKVWITTTHDATARVLKDSETFTLRKEGGALAGLRWWMPAFVGGVRQQHADHGRAGSYAPARDRRRGLPPPRGSRHGAAHSRRRRRSRRQAVRGRKPGRPGRAICAITAAVRSSASCSACRWPTGRNSSPGQTRSHGSRGSPISCA